MRQTDIDSWHMSHAIALAERGLGHVEPNPMVGCVLARGAEIVAEGWHRGFGQPHAEVDALNIARDRARGATMLVTLEPCAHHGKTPPCADAIVSAGVKRVVIAMEDPFPQVAGLGIARLEEAGLDVTAGILEAEARARCAPYLKLIEQGRPWVIAKWAMTLDGKIATRSGASKWISGTESREITHQLRGRVDAIIVGSGTALADDPMLTARPPGPRVATRVVLDSRALLMRESRLVTTASKIPLLVATGPNAPNEQRKRLSDAGCEVLVLDAATAEARLGELLDELGRRRMTNVLVEGGGTLLGALFDAGHVDEAHAFIAPKVIGGRDALAPVAGRGVDSIAAALELFDFQSRRVGDDVYLHGRVKR